MSLPATHDSFMPPSQVADWQRRALLFAIPLTVVAIVGLILSYTVPGNDQFYRAYLLGYMWCIGLSLGSLAILMIYHSTGGAWGTAIRRILEAGSRTIWVMAVAFIPILLSVHRLYHWTDHEAVAHDAHLQRVGAQFLNLPFFTIRAVLYFAIWIGLAVWLNRQSERQDRERLMLDVKLRGVSTVGLVLYGFSFSFAAIDWVMSLDPHWASSVFGLILIAVHGLISFSLAVIVLAGLVRYRPMDAIVESDQFLDIGKLMLASTMLWGWFMLSQWLIIWAGNLPEEIGWYLNRSRGGWREFAFFVVIGQFFVPFLLLLSRGLKSNGRALRWLALWTIFMCYWDLYYYVMPNFEDLKGHFSYSWQDAAVPLAMMSWWLYLFLGYLKRRPLLAVYDDHVTLLLEKGHELEHERA